MSSNRMAVLVKAEHRTAPQRPAPQPKHSPTIQHRHQMPAAVVVTGPSSKVEGRGFGSGAWGEFTFIFVKFHHVFML